MGKDVVQSMVRLAKALTEMDQHVYNLYLLSYTGLRGPSARSVLAAQDRLRGVSLPVGNLPHQ